MEQDYHKPAVTVDLVVFTVRENKLQVLLIKRKLEPFKDKWAIPGGFVRIDESLETAAIRELEEETGLKNVYLEQLYTFGKLDRDPRGRVITVSYLALVNSDKIELKATADASEAKWLPINSLPELGFDHKEILEYALKRLRWKFEYTVVGFSMLPEKFTLSQVQKIYEIVFDKKFDKRNFVKKIHSLNILNEEGAIKEVAHRPPKTYSLKKNVPQILEIL
ncbi:MAG TPA: NUDIX domain-containing protein [Candidatus Nanoarchaeia archaeon]|nr:NUDIX domain-containing protein [Candidatus Nanoarchaeia archaeon]